MKRSRLSQTIQKKSRHQLYLFILGIAVVLFLLIKFGIPLLINFSLFIEGSGNTSVSSNPQSDSVILPPTLNQTFSATNSATITVSGTAVAKETIQLFVNDELSSSTTTKDDGSFSFANVSLSSGQNTIKARVKVNNKQSDFSDSITITFANKQPNLSIDSPSDGQSFSGGNSSIVVSGSTDPDIRVTVNGFWAIVDNKGIYSYNLKLQNGNNQIKVIATDNAGNTTEKDISINYSQ